MNLEAWKILVEDCSADGVSCTTVKEEYGGGNAIELETGLFLYGLMRRLQPISVLETGTHWGFSSSCISLGLNDATILYPHRQPGILLTMDVNEYDGKPEKLWERLGLRNIIHVIDNSEDPKIAKKYLGKMPPLQFVWLDADHAAEAIWREYNHYLPYFSAKKMVLGFHDTDLDKRMPAGVDLIVNDLTKRRADGSGWKHISHVPMRNMRGLDLIYLSNEETY